MAHHGCELRRQNFVHAAKVEAEVDVLQNVSERIDGKHGEEQPRRAEGVRVADVEEDDCAEDRQPRGKMTLLGSVIDGRKLAPGASTHPLTRHDARGRRGAGGPSCRSTIPRPV